MTEISEPMAGSPEPMAGSPEPMAESPEPYAADVAAAVRASVGLLLRRMRQVPVDGELTLPESSALTRLDRSGPATSSALARIEQISPQSMGATLAALEGRGLVDRRPDPGDGRRALLSVSEAGRQMLSDKRNARTEQLARALSAGFTTEELGLLKAAAPLLERLAQSI
jgi:DNA-binding MarR family transcriptional regulator